MLTNTTEVALITLGHHRRSEQGVHAHVHHRRPRRDPSLAEAYIRGHVLRCNCLSPPLVSAGPDYQDPLVMINARLFRALVNAPSNIGHSCFPRLLAALPLASHRRCGRSRRSPAHCCGALALPRPMAARRRSPAAASLLPF